MMKTPLCFSLLVAACWLSFGAETAGAQFLAPSAAMRTPDPFGPSAARNAEGRGVFAMSAPSTVSGPQEETRIDAPRIPGKVIVSLYAGLVTTQALDVHSTLRAIDSGSREANTMMRWATASPVRFIAVKAAATVGTTLILERIRRMHPKRALFLLVGLNSASAVIVAHNYAAGRHR